jgi:hypothetical protein
LLIKQLNDLTEMLAEVVLRGCAGIFWSAHLESFGPLSGVPA